MKDELKKLSAVLHKEKYKRIPFRGTEEFYQQNPDLKAVRDYCKENSLPIASDCVPSYDSMFGLVRFKPASRTNYEEYEFVLKK